MLPPATNCRYVCDHLSLIVSIYVTACHHLPPIVTIYVTTCHHLPPIITIYVTTCHHLPQIVTIYVTTCRQLSLFLHFRLHLFSHVTVWLLFGTSCQHCHLLSSPLPHYANHHCLSPFVFILCQMSLASDTCHHLLSFVYVGNSGEFEVQVSSTCDT